MDQQPSAVRKRPHPDEVVVLDDSDDEEEVKKATDDKLTSHPATVAPVLPRMNITSPTATASPTSKRARPDNEPAPPLPATPKAATHSTSASNSSTPLRPALSTASASASASARTPTSTASAQLSSPSPPPVISTYAFTGLYQPHRFIADDTNENKYVNFTHTHTHTHTIPSSRSTSVGQAASSRLKQPLCLPANCCVLLCAASRYVIAAAYVLSVTLKWNETHTTAALQGRISWRYGLLWLNWDALADDDETLFWDVARQSEIITGQALREHERTPRGGSGGSGRSDVERVRLVMATRELLPIDVSMSQFHDEKGDQDDDINQVHYTLQQFERERRYMLDIEPDGHLTGSITMQMQRNFSELKDGADDDDEDGRDTAIVGWPCTEADTDTSDELQPLQRTYRTFVARMHAVLSEQAVGGEVVGKVRSMLDRVLREPEVEGGKYRRVNRTVIGFKFGEACVEVLRLCGFVEDEVEHAGQRYMVLPDDADLLLVATTRRALPS